MMINAEGQKRQVFLEKKILWGPNIKKRVSIQGQKSFALFPKPQTS